MKYAIFMLACGAVLACTTHTQDLSDDALVPTGCTEIQLGELKNGTQPSPASWSVQPRVVGAPLANLGGALPDTVMIQLRQAATIPANDKRATEPLGNAAADYSTCVNCMRLLVDSKDGAAAHSFVAESGTISIDAASNREQFSGRVSNVVLREVEFDKSETPVHASRKVVGGQCYFVRQAKWDTRVALGCDPARPTSSCGAGQTCEATTMGATDGRCVRSAGTSALGAACTAAPSGDSNCAPGLVCQRSRAEELAGQAPTCHQRCQPFQTPTGCEGPNVCTDHGLCVAPAFAFGGPHDASIAIGAQCPLGRAHACGKDGALGFCADVRPWREAEATPNVPSAYRCYPFSVRRGVCLATNSQWELGYQSVGSDATMGFCYPRTPYIY